MKAQPGRWMMFYTALRLGKIVGEMKVRMSSSELSEWAAFFKLEGEA